MNNLKSQWLSLSFVMNILYMTSHKPTSVRNRPGYIKWDLWVEVVVACIVLSSSLETEFLESQYVWVPLQSFSLSLLSSLSVNTGVPSGGGRVTHPWTNLRTLEPRVWGLCCTVAFEIQLYKAISANGTSLTHSYVLYVAIMHPHQRCSL